MKRIQSIWMLMAGSTSNRLWTTLAAMAVLETVSFGALGRNADTFGAAVNQSRIPLLCAAAFVIFALTLSGCLYGTNDTLGRLKVSGQTVFLCQCGYNSLCLLLLWATQATVLFLLSRWYLPLHPESAGHQGLLVDFYRNGFLFGLLPLSQWSRWGRNVMFVAAMGVLTACVSFKLRQGKWAAAALVTACAATAEASLFSTVLISWTFDVVLSVLLAVAALLCAYGAVKSAGGGKAKPAGRLKDRGNRKTGDSRGGK